MEKKLLFSIIVVSLNAGKTIGKTMESILSQNCDDYEVIVKDGGSLDETVSLVPDNKHFIIIEQKDTGIYDAMNQAIAASNGQYLIFMNCGDTFAHADVLRIVKQEIGNDNPAMVFGNYIRDGIVHEQPGALTSFYLYRTPLCHQTIFFNGELLREKYLYDVSYKILADYDLELRLHFDGCETRHVDTTVCGSLGGGVSESPAGRLRAREERRAILPKYYSVLSRLIYECILVMTFRKLRVWIMSENGPVWLKNFYQTVVNQINRLSR